MKINKLFFAPFIFTLFSSNIVSAQIELEKPANTDENKKVKVFTNEDYFNDSKRGATKNVLKMNPLLIAFGEVPFYYERVVHKYITVEIGLGPTIGNGITMGFAAGADPDAFETEYDSKLGLTFKSGVRFYPKNTSDFPEGPYISPELRYKNYRYSLQLKDASGIQTGQAIDMSSNYLDAVILGGYQFELFDYVFADLYFGAGLRKRHLENVVEEIDPLTQTYYYRPVELNNQKSLLTAGVKFGITF